MEHVFAIVARFPTREFEIRQRCVRDPEFRSVCADYEEAAAALRYWQKAATEGDRRVEEYQSLLDELEAEILERLDQPIGRTSAE
jgi:hypothetical protein